MERSNARAGPSTPRKNVQNKGMKISKAKLEAKATEELDELAMNFTSPHDLSNFADLPISTFTKKGLKKAFFVKMTDIQAQSIPVCLKGKDVLGAARTGSGKTLSFLVPVLEILYRRKWGPQDGLGALIISPTRELAVQIFDVLRSIGGYHNFSAGLIIGGKNLKDERERLDRMNILVATPGRLLQHMDQTFGFDGSNLQMLVLDEADRILDMGFSRTLNALLAHLPRSRQTLLFSATQTDSIQDLARLSLKDPVFIGVKEAGSETATPKALEQHYAVCDLDKKLDILWSFIKSHLQSKILIFMSSGKQVRFVFETFCKLHPGIPLLHLHGKLKQATRLATCTRFTSTKHAALLATDLAARGLDFPSVDWVVQIDAPEDAETYIHRVGRTARYESAGHGLLLLCPSEEEGMLEALEKRGVKIARIKIKESKTQSIENQLQNLAFRDPEIKYLGQRAFVSYMRSVYLHKDKSIFQIDKLPAERFAASLGLPGAPKIKFLSKDAASKRKNENRAVAAAKEQTTSVPKADMTESGDDSGTGSGDEDESGGEGESEGAGSSAAESDGGEKNKGGEQDGKSTEILKKKNGVRTKYDRMFERKNQNILSEHYTKLVDHSADKNGSDSGDDFITIKRADHELPESLPVSDFTSKRKLRLGQSKKAMLKFRGLGQKLLFDEEGKPHEVYEMHDAEKEFKDLDVIEVAKEFAEGQRGKMREVDTVDKEEAKEKKKEKKRKRKEKEKGMRMENDHDVGVRFSPAPEDDGYVSPDIEVPTPDVDDGTSYPPSKKAKTSEGVRGDKESQDRPVISSLRDEEEIALKLLGRR